jgi:AhpD family alkylhydroperoxidase
MTATKEQEIAAVGISVAVGCKPCTSHHVRAARKAGATDEEMKAAVALALSVQANAAAAMETFFLTRLGEPRRRAPSERPSRQPPSRQDALVSVGVALAVNDVSNLPRHMAAAGAAGLDESEVESIMKLSRVIKGKGAYHLERHTGPRIEERVFVFLDLTDSTAITERLGHVRYSRFIRSCFRDLAAVLIQYKAQIYQYVGDEVVLSWDSGDGVKDNTCLRLFFTYQERLQEKSADYEREFGVVPVFRGSMDLGKVTRASVGDIKRDVAYHGNVLHVASRLQELCKVYAEPVLITERVNDALEGSPRFATRFLGNVTLRGQSQEVGVFGVDAVT